MQYKEETDRMYRTAVLLTLHDNVIFVLKLEKKTVYKYYVLSRKRLSEKPIVVFIINRVFILDFNI